MCVVQIFWNLVDIVMKHNCHCNLCWNALNFIISVYIFRLASNLQYNLDTRFITVSTKILKHTYFTYETSLCNKCSNKRKKKIAQRNIIRSISNLHCFSPSYHSKILLTGKRMSKLFHKLFHKFQKYRSKNVIPSALRHWVTSVGAFDDRKIASAIRLT